MPTFERGDIVAAPYPYVEHPVVRRRPALVISTDLGPDGEIVWVLMITSAANQRWPGDVVIEAAPGLSGLHAPSVVRTEKVATIEAESAKRVGRLAGADLAAVHKRLGIAFGLTLP